MLRQSLDIDDNQISQYASTSRISNRKKSITDRLCLTSCARARLAIMETEKDNSHPILVACHESLSGFGSGSFCRPKKDEADDGNINDKSRILVKHRTASKS
jgi:hypothetical protein